MLILTILDHIMYLWWFDHVGVIQCTGLDIIHNLPHFLALLFTFQRFTLKDWGFIQELDGEI